MAARGAPVQIDLCSSDDERDEESPPLSPATAVAAAATAVAAAAVPVEPPLAAHNMNRRGEAEAAAAANAAEAVACPRCTLIQQDASASHCEMCDAPLSAEAVAAAAEEEAAEKEWACSVCEKPLSQLAVEGGTRVVWLETCSHWACVDCHIQWVQARDSQGLEPTCLTASCNSALTDAAIREMLGTAPRSPHCPALECTTRSPRTCRSRYRPGESSPTTCRGSRRTCSRAGRSRRCSRRTRS